ncbi:unnamed protein product, partial [Trichobilharzia szidati]
PMKRESHQISKNWRLIKFWFKLYCMTNKYIILLLSELSAFSPERILSAIKYCYL